MNPGPECGAIGAWSRSRTKRSAPRTIRTCSTITCRRRRSRISERAGSPRSERPDGSGPRLECAALRSEIGCLGLRDREQVLAEMIAVVFGAHHLQALVRHLAPASCHVERFVEGIGVV